MLATGRRLITIIEAAKIAGVTRQTISAWLDAGRLTPYAREIDGRRMVDLDELERKVSYRPPDPPDPQSTP